MPREPLLTDPFSSPGAKTPPKPFTVTDHGKVRSFVLRQGRFTEAQVHLTQQRTKTVRIFAGLHGIAPINLEQVRPRLCEMPDKKAGDLCVIKAPEYFTGIPGEYIDTDRAGQKSPDKLPACSIGVRLAPAQTDRGVRLWSVRRCP